VSDGALKIALRKEPAKDKAYTGGGIISRRGLFTATTRHASRRRGLRAGILSFWAQKSGSSRTLPSPRAQLEIDFCEQDGGDPNFTVSGLSTKFPDAKRARRGMRDVGWSKMPPTRLHHSCLVMRIYSGSNPLFLRWTASRKRKAPQFSHDDMSVWLTSIASTLKGDRWVDDFNLSLFVSCVPMSLAHGVCEVV